MAEGQRCLDPRCTGGLWHVDEDTNTATEPCPINNPDYKTPEERRAAKAAEKDGGKAAAQERGKFWWTDRDDKPEGE